jgi:hypothetical protein
MPMSPALETELLATAGFKSLESERKLVRLTRSLSWDAVHSFYYSDPSTGKSRELDVFARHSYKLFEDKINPLVRVYLLIECKNIENFNLIFSVDNDICDHSRGTLIG